jgi:lysophospholipase L1-like esterase
MKMIPALNLVAIACVTLVPNSAAHAQNIAWGSATGITGDANLSTAGSYFDAFLTDTGLSSSLTADGITFNPSTSSSSTSGSDGKISFTVTSGTNNQYGFATFPTASPSSTAFAAIMNSGGTFETGGAGAGTVTLSGLTVGHTYAVQIFDYANDGDAGLTTLSGSPSVTLSNLAGAAGAGTNGEFATGTFTATGTTESFNWSGAGSGYTVLGAISVRDLSQSQPVTWGNAMGITGDANLSTSGAYVDAFLINTGATASLTADGITFNKAASSSSTSGSDGKISFLVTSGTNNSYGFSTFPTASPSSSAFAAIMDSGGTFESGGAGAGTVTLSGLTLGHAYSVQVFNYANDGDQGLTTLSGSTPVTLSNLPGAAGAGTNGEFATGTFTASSAPQTFNWNGAGSGFTVIGAISVRDTTVSPTLSTSNVINQGDTTTLSANVQSSQAFFYQWQTDNGSGGTSWSNISGATGSSFVLSTGSLGVGNYEYRVVLTSSGPNVTSAPVAVTVIAAAAPSVSMDTTPSSVSLYVGEGITFTAALTGNHPISYQWQSSTDGGATFNNISGATTTSLTLTNLQLSNSGTSYRLMGTNSLGSGHSTAATVTVKPWSAALIQWSAPVSITGLTPQQILTGVSGSYLEAASFFFDCFLPVTAGGQQFTFRSDGASVSVTGSGTGYNSGAAGYGSGALGTNTTGNLGKMTTGNANLDGVLNQFYSNGSVSSITLNNLIAGRQYSVQLFALDNRNGTTAEQANFANPNDSFDVSSTFTMGSNSYVVGTFTAPSTSLTIQENLLTGEVGNINAVVVRALSYTPSVAPVILTQPRTETFLLNHTATFSVVADASPTPAYQWKSGPVGGPYTNLTNNSKYSGTTTATLSISNVATSDPTEYVVTVTNSAGNVTSTPADLSVWTPSTSTPAVIACIGASDVATPAPTGNPNWPVLIVPLLGSGYTVYDFGASGTDMLQDGVAPYWNTPQYTASNSSSPQIVIIMLGSNDSNPQNWVLQSEYIPDYKLMIDHYRSLPTHPRIYMNTLLTAYAGGNFGITDPIVTGIISPWIRQLAYDEGIPLIDVNAATKNMAQNFPDNIHPDLGGAQVVTETVFNGLINAGETSPPPPLIPPNPWLEQDLGAVGITGSDTFSGGVFTMQGSGVDIGGTSDEFNYVYQMTTGSSSITARVATEGSADPLSKTGVMIRNSMDPADMEVSMVVTPGNGLLFQSRSTDGGSTSSTNVSGLRAPYWVRLLQIGNVFTGSYSPDGVNWTTAGSATITMGTNVSIGLVTTSHNNTVLNTSTVDNVTGTITPPAN